MANYIGFEQKSGVVDIFLSFSIVYTHYIGSQYTLCQTLSKGNCNLYSLLHVNYTFIQCFDFYLKAAKEEGAS